jgi:ABC-type lipoprotein export system ATPase subunit
MQEMLKLAGVSKSFPQRGKVLDNLDLEINKGDTIAVSGPSGSGKTTLLNLIGLLDHPDTGSIEFMEKSILEFKPDDAAAYRNRYIGFVFQEHLLLPHLTLMENILLPLFAGKVTPDEFVESEKYAKDLMKEVGIYELSKKHPFMVSGGEAQRTALVRALINRPSLLIGDEPTGSLDAENASIMGDLLLKINRDYGISIILATHSFSLSQRMSKRYSLEKGILIAS